ncbi:BRO family protein [Rhodococcus jostii]
MFQYESAPLRTIVIDEEPWFVASDACKMLTLRDTTSALKMVDDDDQQSLRRSDTPHYFEDMAPQVQFLTVVNESGMYALIFQSRKAEARKIKRWLTHEVLPSIRKTGSYSAAPALAGPELMAAALLEAASTLKAKDARIAELEPKANYVDIFVADSDLLSIRTVASTLGVGETWLRQELISRKWIYVEHSSRWSESKGKKVPQARYSEYSDKKAYFQRVENHDAPRFRGEVMHTLKVTAAGANAIARMVPRWQAGESE